MRKTVRAIVTTASALSLVLVGAGSAGAVTNESTSEDCRQGSRWGTTTISGALMRYDICIEQYHANIHLYLEDTAKDGRRVEAWLVTSINEYEIFEVTGGLGASGEDRIFPQEKSVKVKLCTSDANRDPKCGKPV
ncbi:hypothetical protein KIPE111705_30730 [Kibdelosporangium persicum]|uniref:Uncharacterized protein n=1 Tax=Kibdelosporangium persicum TaxID=2698649 RepID=A0ABX2FFK1_9PSEU|nr:hypothetical protein [Kibdelosporangium persicum]NRN70164.1 hypothetical protein [Kibdelosporangium persicum]